MTRCAAARLFSCLLAPALVAAWAAPAAARDVPTGSTATVTRTRSSDAPIVLWAIVEGDVARRIGLNGWLRPASSYALVDERGYLGTAQVTGVDRDRSCSNFSYELVRARVRPRPERKMSGVVLAMGPVRAPPTQARVVYRLEESDLPPAGDEDLYGAIDLDGDARADLVRYVYECDAQDGRRRAGAAHHCVEIWNRDGVARWRKVLEGDFPPCR